MLAAYLIIINALGLLLMHTDKQKALRGRWRIPEKTLLGIALIGGSFGTYLGMEIFRHKTKHLKFAVGVPVMMGIHAIIIVFIRAIL